MTQLPKRGLGAALFERLGSALERVRGARAPQLESEATPEDERRPQLDRRPPAIAVGVPPAYRAALRAVRGDLAFQFVDTLGPVPLPPLGPRGEVFLWADPPGVRVPATLSNFAGPIHSVGRGPIHSVGEPRAGDVPLTLGMAELPAKASVVAAPWQLALDAGALAEANGASPRLLESIRGLRLAEHNFIGERPTVTGGTDVVLVLCEPLSVRSNRQRAVELLQRVRRRHPDAEVLAWAPPEELSVECSAGIRALAQLLPRTTPLPDALPLARTVCTGEGWGGLWAVLLGAQNVETFDRPAIAGRGLTTDVDPAPDRPALDAHALARVAFGATTWWTDGGEPRAPTERLEVLAHERSLSCARGLLGLPSPGPQPRPALSFRVGAEWRPSVRRLLAEFDFTFVELEQEKDWRGIVRRFHRQHPHGAIVLWGFFQPKQLPQVAQSLGIPIYRFEDPFIRSVGIGAELDAWGRPNESVGINLDSRGMYYDYHSPSDVEVLLQSYPFESDPVLMARARAAIDRIRDEGLTKYNLTLRPDPESILPPRVPNGSRVLVLGQVETDKSILKGCERPVTNNEVVRLAARENPTASILYKPHPVVLRGAKEEVSSPEHVASLCHIITEEVNLPDLLAVVDKVYVITSGAGFEALFHGCEVTCMGSNFYAGWGLTDDRQRVERRTRTLSLEAVFAAFYILHSRYYDHRTHRPASLEQAIEFLVADRERQKGVEVATRAIRELRGGSTDVAVDLLRRATDLNPSILRWREALAEALARRRNHAEALVEYERLLQEPRPRTRWLLGAAAAAEFLGEPDAQVEERLVEAVRGAGREEAAAARLALFGHRYRCGGPWRAMLDEAQMAASAAGDPSLADIYCLASALLEMDSPRRAGKVLRAALTDHEAPVDFPVPLRLRPHGPQGPRDGAGETWVTELLVRLHEGVGHFPPTWTQASFALTHERQNGPALRCHVGPGIVARVPDVQLLTEPGPVCGTNVVVDEVLLDTPIGGWGQFAETLEAETTLVVIPRGHTLQLRKKLGRHPNLVQLLESWLSTAGGPSRPQLDVTDLEIDDART